MSRIPSRSIFAVMAAVLLAIACSESSTTAPEVGELLAARGGNGGGDGGGGGGGKPDGGGGGGKGPTVKSVDPDSGFQGTTIDIEVSGSGYDEGSVVAFERGGVPASKVRVNSTTFVSSRKLRANITIDEDAETGFYDVAVTAKGGKGVGTENFKVQAEMIPADATFLNAPGDGIISDGPGSYDATVADWFNLDAREQVTVRRLCLNFHGQLSNTQVGFSDQADADPVLCDDGYINTASGKYLDPVDPLVGEIDGTGPWMSMMPINSIERPIWLGLVYGREGYNWNVSFGKGCGQIFFPSDAPVVTRTSESTWTIEATTAWVCPGTVKGKPQPIQPVGGNSVNMPVFITAVAKQP